MPLQQVGNKERVSQANQKGVQQGSSSYTGAVLSPLEQFIVAWSGWEADQCCRRRGKLSELWTHLGTSPQITSSCSQKQNCEYNWGNSQATHSYPLMGLWSPDHKVSPQELCHWLPPWLEQVRSTLKCGDLHVHMAKDEVRAKGPSSTTVKLMQRNNSFPGEEHMGSLSLRNSTANTKLSQQKF